MVPTCCIDSPHHLLLTFLPCHDCLNASVLVYGRALDLHSARSQVDFTALADMAADIGLPRDRVASANTVLEVASFANSSQRQALANSVAAAAHATALKHLKGAGVNLEIIIVSRDGELLGRAGSEMPWAGRPE